MGAHQFARSASQDLADRMDALRVENVQLAEELAVARHSRDRLQQELRAAYERLGDIDAHQAAIRRMVLEEQALVARLRHQH